MSHRKQVKHYEQDRVVHELTFSCYRRMPLLTNDSWRRMLGESISAATSRHRFDLLAFVFMPEHVHLLVLPTEVGCSVSALLKAIKRPYSFRIKKILEARDSLLLKRLTIRQRPGVTTFRYWQEGPGYDRNLYSASAIQAAIDYIHHNPIRRNLCVRAVDWIWSSARYVGDTEFPTDPDLPQTTKFHPELLD